VTHSRHPTKSDPGRFRTPYSIHLHSVVVRVRGPFHSFTLLQLHLRAYPPQAHCSCSCSCSCSTDIRPTATAYKVNTSSIGAGIHIPILTPDYISPRLIPSFPFVIHITTAMPVITERPNPIDPALVSTLNKLTLGGTGTSGTSVGDMGTSNPRSARFADTTALPPTILGSNAALRGSSPSAPSLEDRRRSPPVVLRDPEGVLLKVSAMIPARSNIPCASYQPRPSGICSEDGLITPSSSNTS
jgi:hypothetical protein